MPELIAAPEAAAHGAGISQASFVPFAPSGLAADMSRVLAKYNLNAQEFDSQSAALNAAMGVATIGRRVFIPVTVQCTDAFYSASFQRLPLVAANVSRCMGAHTTRSDLNDILSLRDAGWIILIAENNQEVLDSIIMAYRISEDPNVLLPSIININGLGVREPVAVPTEKKLMGFLKKPLQMKFDYKKPQAFNPPVDDYMEFRAQQQKSMGNALVAAGKTFAKWKERFGRSYSAFENYMLDDADYAFVIAGSNAATCRAVVNNLRGQGEKVGMLRMRMLRPFPDVTEALKNVKKVAVVDENISLGSSGIIYAELAQHYHGFACDFISLGRHLTEQNFAEIFESLKKIDTVDRLWLL